MTDETGIQTTSETGVEQVIDSPVEVAETTPEVKEPPKKITRRDAIRSAIDQGRKRLNETEADEPVQGDESEENAIQDSKDDAAKPKRGPGRPAKTQEEEIDPPAWFTAEQKQDFKKIPGPMKRATATLVQNVISNAQRHVQQAVEAKNEAQGVMRAVKPYFNEWNMRGVQVEQGVSQLCAIWDDLHKGREESYVKLISRIGLNPQKIAQLLGGSQSNGQSQNFSLPEDLTKKIDAAYNFTQTQQQATVQQRQQSEQRMWAEVGAGVDSARNELDQAGNYKFPQLHNQNYVQQIAPLIVQLRQANPQLSYADCSKKAYEMVEQAGSVLKGQQSPQTVNQQQPRRQITPISVRSRGASPIQDSTVLKPVKSERRSDTIRRVMQARKQEASSY